MLNSKLAALLTVANLTQLYYTLNGPCPELVGQEEAFPGPDNQSKMKRSCENAEHVGKQLKSTILSDKLSLLTNM